MRFSQLLKIAGIALLLAACQSTPSKPQAAAQDWPDLKQEFRAGGGTVYAVDAEASKVRIYVYRGGAAGKAGHNHVLSANRFKGYVRVADSAAGSGFDLRVPLADLTVDDPAARKATGDAFSGERSASDIEGTRGNMFGPKGLDAAGFPQVRLRSTAITGDWPILAADVEVTLHGVSRTQTVMLTVHRSHQKLTTSGQFVLRQSDFGVTPFSALGGLLKVEDPVSISFEIVARPINL